MRLAPLGMRIVTLIPAVTAADRPAFEEFLRGRALTDLLPPETLGSVPPQFRAVLAQRLANGSILEQVVDRQTGAQAVRPARERAVYFPALQQASVQDTPVIALNFLLDWAALPSIAPVIQEALATRRPTILTPYTVGVDFMPGAQRRTSSAIFSPIVWRDPGNLSDTHATGVVMDEFSLNDLLAKDVWGDAGLDIVVEGFTNATGVPAPLAGPAGAPARSTILVRSGSVGLNSSQADTHDPAMDPYRRVLAPMTDGTRGFTLTVSPTREYREGFRTRFPTIGTAAVVSIIVGIALFFGLIEVISERLARLTKSRRRFCSSLFSPPRRAGRRRLRGPPCLNRPSDAAAALHLSPPPGRDRRWPPSPPRRSRPSSPRWRHSGR